jgi:hypothetical protein
VRGLIDELGFTDGTNDEIPEDLGKRGAFSDAEWVNAMSGATPFLTRLAATGARSMMPDATAVVYESEKFFVISSSPSRHSNEAKNFSNQKR